MGDYLEEINTALATRGEGFYYESLEDVKSDLESESEYHKDRATHFGTGTASILGTGIAGSIVPEFYSQTAELMSGVSQGDLAAIGLVGALGLSAVPGYVTKQHKDKRDEINQIIRDLEEGNFDEDSTDFAYRIADKI